MSKHEILEASKYPVSKDKHVGIEIEFVCPYESSDLEEMLVNLDLQNNCSLTDDGSVEDHLPSLQEKIKHLKHICNELYFDSWVHYCGACEAEDLSGGFSHELRVLTTEKELREVLNKVNAFLTKAKAEVNETCGLHVHLDMRNRDFKICVKRLLAKQKEMRRLVNKARLTSSYCKPLKKNKLKDGDRYKDINVSSFEKLGTIEVRIHEGCVSTSEIYNWCKYLVSVTDKKKVSATYVKKRIAMCS